MNMHAITRSALLFLALIFIGVSAPAFAKAPPVLMLMQPKGTVEYSKTGTKWKKVRRNKFLFSGYQIRTAADGSGTLINQESGMARQMSSDTLIKVTEESAELISGNLSDPKKADASLTNGLKNRFSKAQRYTTIRRSVTKADKPLKLSTIRQVTLSQTYPELVWANAGNDYSYRLTIDGQQVTEVPATQDEFIRIKISALSPGEHPYRVEVITNGEVAFKPRRDGKILWLSSAEEKSINDATQTVDKVTQGDKFLLAAHLEAQGLSVPAMDLYRQHFQENPDDNDMRPILIQTYHDLKLSDLKKREAVIYNTMLADE